MIVADETLMAYSDGELDAAQRAHIAAALEVDASLRQRVAALRLQRERVENAFASVLDEPVPDRLTRLLQTAPEVSTPSPRAAVVNLAEVRAQRQRDWDVPSWAQWGGMAASVVLGVLLGTRITSMDADPGMGLDHGRLIAGGAIAKALTHDLASEPMARASVAVQLSFVDKTGSYCRTFSTASLAGLACQESGRWAVQSLATVDATAGGEVRQAATALPRAVLDAVEQRMAGDALNGQGERTARDKGWRR